METKKSYYCLKRSEQFFWDEKQELIKLSGNDIKVFVKWYKNIMSKIDKKQHKKLLKLDMKNFFKNFETESRKLCKLLGIKNNINHKFNLEKHQEICISIKSILLKKK